MIMSTTEIVTVAVGGRAVPHRSQVYCKGGDTCGDNTLLLLVDAKSSPQTLNNGVSADLNDEVGGAGMCLRKRGPRIPLRQPIIVKVGKKGIWA